MEDKKLFIVEFGEAEIGSSYSQRSIYVIAKDYNEAAKKALMYEEYKNKNKPKKILNSTGDLVWNEKEEQESVKVKAVRLASEEVIW